MRSIVLALMCAVFLLSGCETGSFDNLLSGDFSFDQRGDDDYDRDDQDDDYDDDDGDYYGGYPSGSDPNSQCNLGYWEGYWAANDQGYRAGYNGNRYEWR